MSYATELWSARTWKPGESASQTFIVTGAATMAEAAGAPIVPAPASTFILDNRLRAQQPEISTPNSPTTYHVVVNFAAPQSSGSGGNSGSSDNLSLPPQYHPQITLSSEDTDTDVDGNPITASSREGFSRAQKVRFPAIRYIYRRWESSFDGQRALRYTRSVNADTFNMPGFGFVAEGQAFCEGITVVSPYDRNASAVQVQYAFELREDGFRTRILDEGVRAWYTDGSTQKQGQLTDAKGNLITSPIRLDGYGAPFDDNVYTVGGATPTGISSPPTGAEVELTQRAAFLRYKLYKAREFAGLTLTP